MLILKAKELELGEGLPPVPGLTASQWQTADIIPKLMLTLNIGREASHSKWQKYNVNKFTFKTHEKLSIDQVWG